SWHPCLAVRRLSGGPAVAPAGGRGTGPLRWELDSRSHRESRAAGGDHHFPLSPLIRHAGLPGKRHDAFDFLVQRRDPDLSGLALRHLRLKERVTRLWIAAEVPVSDAQRALQASRHLLAKRWIPDHPRKLQTGLEFLDRLFVPTLADQYHPT